MKMFAKLALNDDFFEINVCSVTASGAKRVRKRILPRQGWEELEPNYWVLSCTRKWVCPLFMRRKVERGVVVYSAYEGEKK